MINKNKTITMRQRYTYRFIFRIILLLIAVGSYMFFPEQFDIMVGWNFFKKPSIFHIYWIVWMLEMFTQIKQTKAKILKGSTKQFKSNFKPTHDELWESQVRVYSQIVNEKAVVIMVVWSLITLAIALLRFNNIIDTYCILMIVIFYYVCDLFCVLIWCPFRAFMKNRCCTTCRIFNWDSILTFHPFFAVPKLGFFTISLLTVSVITFLKWEITFANYPERFWDMTNENLKCANCNDKLCKGRIK